MNMTKILRCSFSALILCLFAQATQLPNAFAAKAKILNAVPTAVPNAELKRKALERVEATLLVEFPGRDAYIQSMMTAARINFTKPHLAKKPFFFYWFSQPGGLKTSLIRRYHELLAQVFAPFPDVGLDFHEITLSPGTLLFPIDQIREANGQGIVYINEFQNLVPYAELLERLSALKESDAISQSGAHAAEIKVLEAAIVQRKDAEDYLWELTATGRITITSKLPVATHLESLKGPIREYIDAEAVQTAAQSKVQRLESQLEPLRAVVAEKKAKMSEGHDRLAAARAKAKEEKSASRGTSIGGGGFSGMGDSDYRESAPTSPAVDAALAAYRKMDDELETARAAVSNLIEGKIVPLRAEISSSLQIQTNAMTRFGSAIKLVLQDRPDLLDIVPANATGKALNEEDVIRFFKADPSNFDNAIFLRSRTLGKTPKRDGRKLQVFIDGNIEDTIGEPARRRFRQGSSQTADDYHAAVAEFATQANLAKFMLDRFSPREGWDSRLNLSVAHYMMPEDTKGLRRAARQRLNQNMREFSEEMKRDGHTIKMVLDRSVDLLLDEASSDALGQYRTLSGIWETFFGPVFLEAPVKVTNITKGEKPTKVTLVFDRETRMMKLVGTWKAGVIPGVKNPELFSYKVANISLSASNQTAQSSVVSDRIDAYHQVGHLLMGAMLYGSVPVEVSRILGNSGPGSSRLWADPEGNTLAYKRAHIFSIIGGILAERKLSHPAEVSAASLKDIAQSQDLVAHFLATQAKQDSYYPAPRGEAEAGHSSSGLVQVGHLSEQDQDHVMAFEATSHFQSIQSPSERNQLAKIYVLVSKFIGENRALADRLVEELMKESTLSGAAIKKIMQEEPSGINPDLLDQILRETPGTVVLGKLPSPFSRDGSSQVRALLKKRNDQARGAVEAEATHEPGPIETAAGHVAGHLAHAFRGFFGL